MTARNRFTSMSWSSFSGSFTGLNWPVNDSTIFWKLEITELYGTQKRWAALIQKLPLAMPGPRESVLASAQHRVHHVECHRLNNVTALCIPNSFGRHRCRPSVNIDAKYHRWTYSSQPPIHRNSTNWQISTRRPCWPVAAKTTRPLRAAFPGWVPAHPIQTGKPIKYSFHTVSHRPGCSHSTYVWRCGTS